MSKDKRGSEGSKRVSRRNFLSGGGVVLAGSALAAAGCATTSAQSKDKEAPAPEQKTQAAPQAQSEKITTYRTLGRTGFQVSDIAMGCGMISEANVVRYAYDHGINLFDTAERYGNGDSETKIGQVMGHMDRKKIFIVTKLKINEGETEQSLRERFAKCLARMKTDYADALYMHAVDKVELVKNEAFHQAVAKLKADGKLKHAGISSHGPRKGDGQTMAQVLGAAVEDGRFDLMLLVHNFMNNQESDQIIRACKEKNVGTTGMKVNPGVLKIDPFDPENPSEEYAKYIDTIMKRGKTRAQANQRIQDHLDRQKEAMGKTGPFMKKYGLTTELELHNAAIRWALAEQDLHTLCLSLRDFDLAGRYIPLSGTKLSQREHLLLKDWALAFGSGHCRHGCTECSASCSQDLPISTIMRYAYYFQLQGREKQAMQKYARLGRHRAESCLDCPAPCRGACPHGVDVQANMLNAHNLLRLA